MDPEANVTKASEQVRAAHETVRWTRRYAQSRAVPVLVFMAVFIAIWVTLSFFSFALGWALHGGHTIVFWFCVPAVVALIGFVVWLSVPRWGGLWLERLGWRYYDREGSVTIPCVLPRDRMQRIGRIVALLFGTAIFTHVILGVAGYTPIEYMQPISALYTVPFIVFIALATRTYPQLLVAVLYGLHAILLTAGVPFRFWSNPALDLPIAVMGYMTLGALASHAYNRYALLRLKRAGRAHLENGEGA